MTANELVTLRSERLLLRPWLAEDVEPFVQMNSDPRVMEYFPAVMTREMSLAAVERIQAHFAEHRFGLWAVEIPGRTSFAGFVGLCYPRFEAHFTPCVEVAWRLAHDHWGHGFATEGAARAVAFGFERLGLREIVSMTVPENYRSRRVMEKLRMSHDARDDFDHPLVPDGHRLQRHVLYRLAGSFSSTG